MPKKLYNEGRVCGLSAFEIYAKQALATPGVTEVATEREWLASTIANGASLLLQIPGGLTAGVYDIKLPSDSRLVGANTIIGSFAYGVESDLWENATTVQTISQKFRWAKRVTCYGNISKPPTSKQTSAKGMSNNNNSTAAINEYTSEQMQYIKIIDGIVYQYGKWKLSSVENNDKIKTVPDDIQYDQTYVRLAFRDDIASNKPFYILLTGFTDLAVVYGVTGLEGDPTNISNNINDWKNGGFLGPSKFPWASKIWFATPGNLTYELKMGLSGAGHPNIKITSNKDTVDTKIEVMNNITSDKTAKFLKITAKDWNGNVLDPADDAAEIPYAAQHSLDIDGKALIEDILAPGIGTNIVDSTTDPKNSYGTARKVIKTNINAPNASGIAIDPLSSSSNAQGAQVQNISTNLVSDNGSGIDYENGTGTAKKIKTVLESGKGTGITISAGSGKAKKIVTNLSAGTGIQIGNKTEQGDIDTSKTIATNILVGNGLQINKLSSKDDTGAQTISHNLVNGTGVSIGTRAELGISTTAITNNGTEAPTISGAVKPIAELKLHDTVRYDNTRFRWDGSKWLAQGKASNATTGRPTIIYSNIKSDGSIAISPASASTANSAQTINTNLKQGTGIAVNNTNGNIQSRLTPGVGIDINPASGTTDSAQTIKSTLKDGKGTKVTNGSASGTSGGSQQIDLNLRAGNGISVDSRDGVVTITNTLPNTSQLGGFVQLTVDDIGFIFDNGVTVYDSEMVCGNWENYLGETKAYWNYSPEEARRAFEVRPSTINTHGKYKQFNFSIRPIWDYDGIVREVLFSTSKSGHGWIENGRSRSYVYAYSRPTYLHALHAYLYNSDFSDEYGSAERKQDAINSILCGIRVRDSNKQITDPTNPDNTFNVSDLANFYVFNHTCGTSIMNGGGIGMYGVGVNHKFSMVEVSTEMHGFHYNTIFGPSSPLQCKNADFAFVLQSFSDGINGQILDYPIQVNFPRAYIESGYNFNAWKSKVESNMIYQDVNFSSTGTFRRKGN